jgi:alpha-beta hydrolase superfamily lysophospholipase
MLVEAYPQAQHFLVGHSHGGNVACYTLRDDQSDANHQEKRRIAFDNVLLF